MKRIFVLICLLAFAGTAFAGVSIGFKTVEVATGFYTNYDPALQNMYMLRLGFMASPSFRVEGLLGYQTYSGELSNSTSSDTYDWDGSVMAVGAGGYYVIAAPANTQFSLGGQFVYGTAKASEEGTDDPDITFYTFSPLMRIDFSIPGAERFALFTEYGIRYGNVSSEYTEADVTYKLSYTGWETYCPQNVLAGAYYVF